MIEFALAGTLLGLAGSIHCVGMCGPLVLAIPTRQTSALARIVDRVTYHGARIGTYGILGALVGVGAGVVDLVGYGQPIAIAAGVMMVIMALAQIVWHANLLPMQWVSKGIAPLRTAALRAAGTHPRSGMILLGVVNGLLPCGLVTSALVGSAAGGDSRTGLLFMASFGLGTLPTMLLVSVGAGEVRQRFGKSFNMVLPVVALLLGGLMMLRGMELGIPYVSPASPAFHAQHAHGSCCAGPKN